MNESLNNLIGKLRDETSFVQSEKKHIFELYRQVVNKSEQLFQKQWSIGRQHLMIDDLIFGRNNKLSLAQVCSKFSMLNDQAQFTESHKVFGHNDYHVSEFFRQLRENPKHVADLIVKSEKCTQTAAAQLISGVDNQLYFSNQILIPILFQSVYGNCVLTDDETYCLQVLKNLIEIQFSSGSNTSTQSAGVFFNAHSATAQPSDFYSNNIDFRRLIRKHSCSFNVLFRFYTSFAFSTQLFLHTSLHEPITHILSDEWYLDIDPDKALGRFSQEEILSRFGQPNSKEYKLKTMKYREKIVNQLYSITCLFIESISSNIYCFPQSLTWLVNQLYRTVTRNFNSRNQNSQQDLARKLCCDLIMSLYICPALCDPEPYGIISDIQITPVARHNLMQIAHVLQALAMSDDDKDLKAQDLYSKFRNNCVSDILNSLIWPTSLRNGSDSISDLNLFSMPRQSDAINVNPVDTTSSITSSNTAASMHSTLLTRTSIMIALSDVHKILIFASQLSKQSTQLISTQQNPIDNSSDEFKKWLKSVIPGDYINQALESICSSSNVVKQLQGPSNINTKHSLLTPTSSEVITSLLKDSEMIVDGKYQVLILSINDKNYECPGMLSEDKVIKEYEASQLTLKNCQKTKSSVCAKHSVYNHSNEHAPNNSMNQHTLKRSQANEDSDILDSSFEPSNAGSSKLRGCFDLIDQGMALRPGTYEANEEEQCCDTLDCGSLSSSDDEETNDRTNKHDLNQILDDIDDANQLEQLRDGLSDIDAFSGRDTPIISGRDTPSSHSHEDLNNSSANKNISLSRQNRNDAAMLNHQNSTGSTNALRGPQLLPVTVQKANREDINDKFCKFEINKACNMPLREEQMSEAWSLDADPPESVTNEIMNDPLDENTSNANSSVSSMNPASSRVNAKQVSSSNPSHNPNQGNFNTSEQDANFSINTNLNFRALNPTQGPAFIGNEPVASISMEPDLATEGDRFSSVSDSAAWSTDLINNSDSDLESNSPSKYTPYSTYSSNSSHNQHAPINQSTFFQSSGSLNQNQQSNTSTLVNSQSNAPNTINTHNKDPLANPASPSIITAAANSGIDLIKNAVKSIDTGLNNWNFESLTHNSASAKGDASSQQSKKNSILSTNSSNSNGGQQPAKRGLFHRFSMNTNKNAANNSPNPPASLSAPGPAFNQVSNDHIKSNNSADNIENILKKYVNKTTTFANSQSAPVVNEGVLIDLSVPESTERSVSSPMQLLPKNASSNSLPLQQTDQTSFAYDTDNLEQSKMFLDAKKKLRIVLSLPDCFCFIPLSNNKNSKDNFLKMYLKTQLYEAISLQDMQKEAQLYETIRCVSVFTDHDCYKLLRALKKDYNRRIYYMTYLTKSKQNILRSLNLIEKLVQRAKWRQSLCSIHLTSVVARTYLETKENETRLNSFVNEFRSLPSVDEKFDLYKSFTEELKLNLKPVWVNSREKLMELGETCLERLAISRVYRYAMFPNGEIDQFRDSKVSECFSELANVVTSSHPLIGISPIYENECPWTAAQKELRRINIFKTPQDKLECIKRCLLTIQNLLAIAKSPVCADDLHPVLIYVIIKANPPTFLSNVQYIEGFYGSQLESEDYYWAQFIFAFSYIKANMIGNKVT